MVKNMGLISKFSILATFIAGMTSVSSALAGECTGDFCVAHANPQPVVVGQPQPQILLEQDDTRTPAELDLARLGGSAALIVQTGDYNQAFTGIINSPGTVVRQDQFGDFNESNVHVWGGELNRINVEQRGNGFESDIYMLHSERTTVNSGQGPNSQKIKKLFVLYGKPGTTINTN